MIGSSVPLSPSPVSFTHAILVQPQLFAFFVSVSWFRVFLALRVFYLVQFWGFRVFHDPSHEGENWMRGGMSLQGRSLSGGIYLA